MFFLQELKEICHAKHPLVILAKQINWQRLEELFVDSYANFRRSGLNIRLMISLQYLKYTYNLSDEQQQQVVKIKL